MAKSEFTEAEIERKFERRKPRPSSGPFTEVTRINPQQARDECQEWIKKHISNGLGSKHQKRGARFYSYPPGIGKTTALINALSGAGLSEDASVLVVGNRHDQLEAIGEKLGRLAVHRRGRQEPGMCDYPEVVKAAYPKGLDVNEAICNSCLSRPNCGYFAQWDSDAPIELVTDRFFKSHRMERRWNSETKKFEPVDWKVVIFDDADPVQGFLNTRFVTSKDLVNASLKQDEMVLKHVFRTVAALVETMQEEEINGTALWDALKKEEGVGQIRKLAEVQSRESVELPLDLHGMPTKGDIERQPNQFTKSLVTILAEEANKALQDIPFNSALRIRKSTKKKRQVSLEVRQLTNPRFLRQAELLVLSATPDEFLWPYVLTVEIEDVNLVGDRAIEQPTGTSIVQYADYFSSKTTIENPKHWKFRLEQIDRLVSQANGKIGIITFKDRVEELKDRYSDSEVEVLHFYAQAGLNDFQDVKTLIVVGRPAPNPIDLLADMSAIYKNDVVIDSQESMESQSFSNRKDDTRYEVKVRREDDPRMETAMATRIEGELYQAICRARPFEPGREVKIYLLTEQPVPGTWVTEGLELHLTGLEGWYCPELDDRTKRICDAANSLATEKEAFAENGFTSTELAMAAFGKSDTSSKNKIRIAGLLHEIRFHCGLISNVESQSGSFGNGGSRKYNALVFRPTFKRKSHDTSTL